MERASLIRRAQSLGVIGDGDYQRMMSLYGDRRGRFMRRARQRGDYQQFDFSEQVREPGRDMSPEQPGALRVAIISKFGSAKHAAESLGIPETFVLSLAS